VSPAYTNGTLPPGWRYMTAHEAETMGYGDPIVLWNGELCHGLVSGFKDDSMRVILRSGAVITLDLDHPDYWADGVHRDRRPPMDSEFVALHDTEATADEDVEPLLRTSVALARMMKDDPELQQAVARVREIVQNRLRGRAA
jgi:hypothetical protein